MAVAEAADRATVKVYDVATLRRKKTLERPDVACSAYEALCFGLDDDNVLALGSKALVLASCTDS